jgi:hypothetical protein
MRHIEETEFGLLPNPLAQAREQTNFEAYDARMKRLVDKGNKPFTMPLDQMALRGLLPTPTAMDSTNATANVKSTQVKQESMHSVTLSRAMSMGMLPTPTATDFKGAYPPTSINKYPVRKNMMRNVYQHLDMEYNSKTSQLSPQFVMEMMGFPTDWTILPFLNGEKNQSKEEEMQ